MKAHWVVAGFALLLSIGKAEELTWQRAVELTAKNNAELHTAAANLRALESKESVARSGFLPSVSATLGYEYSEIGTAGGGDTVSKDYAATLSASQNLFAGFLTLAAQRNAAQQAEIGRANLRSVRAKVSFDLKSSFQGYLFAKANKKLSTDILKRRQDNLRLVNLRFEGGRENKGSVLLSKANFLQAQYEELQSRNAERVARSELAKVLGLEPYVSFDVVGTVPAYLPATEPDFQKIVAQTAEYQQAFAQAAAADAAITAARAQFYPSLDLTGSIGKGGPEFFPSESDRKAVGLSLTVPLFSGGKDFYGTKSALATWSAASYALTTTLRSLVPRLEQSYAKYTESVAKLSADESFREAAQIRAEIARRKYNTGLLSFEDWDQIENDLIARQRGFLSSQLNRIVSEAGWEQAQSEGIFK